MTQPNTLNFVLTSPVHFETSGFDGKSGDVCVWRAPGQLVVYRAGALVGNFPLSHVSVAALRSESIFSLNAPPKHVDTSRLPSLGDNIVLGSAVKAAKTIEEEEIQLPVMKATVPAPVAVAPIVVEEPAPEVGTPAAEPEAPAPEPETLGVEESSEEVETPEEAPAADAAPAAPKKSKKK